MTTFIATKEYLAADRGIVLNGIVYHDSKIRTINNRVGYFFGENFPSDGERRLLEKHLYRYLFGAKEHRPDALFALSPILGENTLFAMTRKVSLQFEKDTTDDSIIRVFNHGLQTPVVFGSGGDLATVGWACGQSPEDIILTVQEIDFLSSGGVDVIYREALKK